MKRTKQRRPSFVVTVSILASVSGCKGTLDSTDSMDAQVDDAAASDASTYGACPKIGDPCPTLNDQHAFEDCGAPFSNGEFYAMCTQGGWCSSVQNPPSPLPGDCPMAPPTPGTPCPTRGGFGAFCQYELPAATDASPNGCGAVQCDYGIWCGAVLDPACTPPPFAPSVSWKPPTAFHQGKCTDAQVSAFVDCLSGLPDAATCKTFGADAANQSCIACAATPSTAAAYGPLVEGTVTISINEAGCVALASGDTTPTGCGAKLEALSQCEAQACAQASPSTCSIAADQTVCKVFADDAQCATALEAPGGVAAECMQSGATFTDNAKAMVSLFCGGVITDAGGGG